MVVGLKDYVAIGRFFPVLVAVIVDLVLVRVLNCFAHFHNVTYCGGCVCESTTAIICVLPSPHFGLTGLLGLGWNGVGNCHERSRNCRFACTRAKYMGNLYLCPVICDGRVRYPPPCRPSLVDKISSGLI